MNTTTKVIIGGAAALVAVGALLPATAEEGAPTPVAAEKEAPAEKWTEDEVAEYWLPIAYDTFHSQSPSQIAAICDALQLSGMDFAVDGMRDLIQTGEHDMEIEGSGLSAREHANAKGAALLAVWENACL